MENKVMKELFEDKTMKNNAVIISSDLALESNYNADMTGLPQQDPWGNFTVSSHSIKFLQKQYFLGMGEKVFAVKSFKDNDEKDKSIKPRTQKERYEKLVGEEYKIENAIKNVFKFADSKQYGVVVAIGSSNFAIRGAAQQTEGYNLYPGTSIIEKRNISPYQNSKKEDSLQTSLGCRNLLDIARFAHSTCVYPEAYRSYVDDLKCTEGYTEEDLDLLCRAHRYGPSFYKSSAKGNINNELTIVIKTKENVAVDPMHRKMKFIPEKAGAIFGTYVLDLSDEFKADEIESIEVYYDNKTCDIDLTLPKDYEGKVEYRHVKTGREINRD